MYNIFGDVIMTEKIIVKLNEDDDKDWQEIAQEWCDIGRQQGRQIQVLHWGKLHTVFEVVE